MRFNVTVIDPPGSRFTHFLFDSVRYLARSIESLGHECTITRNTLEHRRVNVLVGVHLLTDDRILDDLADAKGPYVVVQTELVRGRPVDPAQAERFDAVFTPLVRGATAVWESGRTNMPHVEALGAHVQHLRFGYHPALEEVRPHATRDVDFCFVGSLTPHRQEMIARLKRLGYRVAAGFDEAAIFRNDLFARSEIILTLRQSETQAHLPHGRVIYCVNNRLLVAGDSGEEQQELEDVFLWPTARGDDEAIELLRATRARSDRRQLADTFYERLKSRPMTAFMAPLVEDACRTL